MATTSKLRRITPKPRLLRTSRDELGAEIPTDDGIGDELEALMLKLATGDRFERLGAIAHEHLLTTDRNGRGRYVRSVCEALSVPREFQVAWAAACELLNAASLIHDDVQDGSRYRSGAFSVWIRHGTAQAINAGDLLLALPYLALEHLDVDSAMRWELSRVIASSASETVRGQSLELSLFSSGRYAWPDYEEAVRAKSTACFVLPIKGAALLSGRSREDAERIARPFAALGLLRQIAAEVLDLFGVPSTPERGRYVREGKLSALCVEHLSRMPRDLEWLGPLLGKGVESTTDRDVDLVTQKIIASGALDAVLARFDRAYRAVCDASDAAEIPALGAIAGAFAHRAHAALTELAASR